MQILINIANKIAKAADTYKVVCGNSNYIVLFTFDEEWNEHLIKTARFAFVQDGIRKHIDVVFENDRCFMPVLSNTHMVEIGVFAGDLRTTTPCMLLCEKSILCESGVPEEPSEDVYNQIIKTCNQAVQTANDVEQRANSGEFKGDKGDKGNKGDKGDSYVLTDADKQEIAGMVNAPKVIDVSNMYEVPEEERKYTAPSINMWAKDASGYVTGGGGVVLCSGLESMLAEEIADKDKLSDIGQDVDGTIYANLKPAFEYADTKKEEAVKESNSYTDKAIGSILKGSAFGEVIAIDDISPINKKINLSMKSKNLYYNTTNINKAFNGITANGNAGESEIILNGTATSVAGTTVNTISLQAGTYTFSVYGMNDADKINLQNADDKTVIGTIKVGTTKTHTITETTRINIVVVIASGNSYDNQPIQIQAEKGTIATEYTPYFTEFDIAGVYVWGKDEADKILYEGWQVAEGAIDGFYPKTNLMIETVGSTMNVEYSRDLNKAFEELTQAIISLGGNV